MGNKLSMYSDTDRVEMYRMLNNKSLIKLLMDANDRLNRLEKFVCPTCSGEGLQEVHFTTGMHYSRNGKKYVSCPTCNGSGIKQKNL